MVISVDGLIRKHRPVWNVTVRNPLVMGVRDGTLPRTILGGFLVHTFHLAEAHFAPLCRLLAIAPPPDRPLLLQAVQLLRDETAWCERRIASKGLDATGPAHPAVVAMRSQLIASGFEPYVVGLVSYWTQARSFADAWTAKRPPSGAYRDLLLRWGDPRVTGFVRRVGRAADRALAAAPPRDRIAAEQAFAVVVQLKLHFWTAALG